MSSCATLYRNNNPEYREKERIKWREIENNKYKNDDEYKQKKKEKALAYYYRKKEQKKLNECSTTN